MNGLDFSLFPLVLVVLTFITGIVWALDKLWLKSAGIRMAGLVEFLSGLFPVIFFVLILRSFVVEPFRIPSGSMMPTLLTGDFILVNKFTYGLRLPVLNWEIVDFGKPERGDVVVFRYPPNPRTDFIKRIIGVPGDEIIYQNKKLHINGQLIDTVAIGPYFGSGADPAVPINEFNEQLSGSVHRILVTDTVLPRNGRYIIPEGKYFVMGDNRDNSHDSRYWGFVPEDHLVGHAFLIWMSWDWQAMRPQVSRIGSVIE